MRPALAVVIALVAAMSVIGALATTSDPFQLMVVQRPAREFPAPLFRLHTLEGMPLELAELRGKVVLLYFWRTWCPYCRRDLPALVSLATEFREMGLVLLGITSEPASTVTTFFTTHGYRFTTVLDPPEAVSDRYRFSVTPTMVIIGRDGQVRGRVIGGREWDSADGRALLRSLLAVPD